jgi:hypothetical protein
LGVVIAVLLCLPALPATAVSPNPSFPGTPTDDPRDGHLPADPDYASHEGPKAPTGCPIGLPPNIYDEQFGWFSFPALGASCPPGDNYEPSGVSIDKAWQLTLGRPDVVIAQIDTGIRWESSDLRRQVHLNWGELPPPEVANGSSPCDGLDLSGYPVRGPAPPCYLNGETFFNVDSYKADPRVVDFTEPGWTESATPAQDSDGGKINAADLIHSFTGWCKLQGAWVQNSACVNIDSDGNGYAHDVAGWDFLDNDNDPFDLNSYSSANNHGTGRASDAVDQGNNGSGGIGSCPACTYLPLRLHSFFITDDNGVGAATLYATDNGASVIEMAFAAVNNTPFSRAAVAYAVSHGAVPVSITQDLNTADHLYPESYPDVLTIAGAVPDSMGLGQNGSGVPPSTYYRNSNLTAPGDHLDVMMEGAVTGSVASAQASGVVGLLMARSRELAAAGFLERPLTALEAEQVIERSADGVTTADALNHCGPDAHGTLYCPPGLPSVPIGQPDPTAPGTTGRVTSATTDGGWSSSFGYGRINASAALRMLGSPASAPTPSGAPSPVLAMKIPPEVSLQSPDWWDQVDPAAQASIQLRGYLGATRTGAGTASVVLEGAPGAEPAEGQFVQLANLGSFNGSRSGVLGSVSTSALAALLPSTTGSPANREAFSVTLRLRVTDAQGMGETRRVVHVHHDPTVHPGFPRNFGAGVVAGVHNTDLRGDGSIETIVATDAGELHVLDQAGQDVPWFNGGAPFRSQRGGSTLHTGAPGFQAGLPVPWSSFVATPVVGDLFGDGRQEIVAADIDGRVYALDASGQLLPGFPVAVDPSLSLASAENKNNHQQRGITASPVLAHLDEGHPGTNHPGQLDIVVGALDQHLYVWRPDGVLLPSFNGGQPKLLQDHDGGNVNDKQGAQITSTPAVGPLLADGHQQIVVQTTEMYSPSSADLNTLRTALTNSLNGSPALQAITGLPANIVSTVVQNAGQGSSSRLYAVDRMGAMLSGWPAQMTGIAPDALTPVATTPPVIANFGAGPRVVASLFTAPVVLFNAAGQQTAGLPITQGAASGTSDKGVELNALGQGAVGDFSGTGPSFFEGGITANELVNAVLVGQNLPFDHTLQAWDVANTGQSWPNFPRPMEDYQAFVMPAIGAVGGPAVPCALSNGQSVVEGSGLYVVHAFSACGTEAAGFPKFTGGWANNAAAVADSGSTGHTSLYVATHEGRLFAWDTAGDSCANNQWWAYHHDEWNSGAYGAVTRPPGAITDLQLRDVVHGPAGGFTAEWTASGAEFRCGNATNASVRVSPNPITPQNFDQATEVATPNPGTPGQDPVIKVSGQNLGTCVYVALQVRNGAGLRSPLAEVHEGPADCAAIPTGSGVTPQKPPTTSTTTPTANPPAVGGLPNTAGGAAGGGLWIALGLSLAWLSTRRRLGVRARAPRR